MDKSTMIAEFYSLRAGLSLIAQEKDKLDAKITAAEQRKTIETEQARFVADAKIAESSEKIRKSKKHESECVRQSEALAVESTRLAQAKAKAWSKYYELKKRLDETRESTSTVRRERLKTECKHDIKINIFKLLILILNIAMPIIAVLNAFLFNRNRYVFLALAIISVCMLIITFIKILRIDNNVKMLVRAGNGFFIAFCIALTLISFLSSETNVCLGISFGCSILSTPFFIAALVAVIVNARDSFSSSKSVCEHYKGEVKKLPDLENTVAVAEQEYENARREYDNAYQAQSKANNAIYKAQYELEQVKKSHDSFVRSVEEEYNSTCAKINERYETTCAAAKTVHSEIGSSIYDLLVKQYGKMLDARDWKIVDLVIWQLETGRADTLKEALQLADRERQTNRIVASINSATAYISSSIQDGVHSLQTQLDDNFRVLACGFAKGASLISRQIDELSERVADSARALSEQIDVNAESSAALYERQIDNLLVSNKNMEQLVSQTTLNTALLEKSNQSSETLVAAVEKLRKA